MINVLPPSGEKLKTLLRDATRDDLPFVVRLLADDSFGMQREVCDVPLPESYYRAFQEIDRDGNNEMIVAEMDGDIVGVLQLTFIPGITHQGAWRAQIEGVRVATSRRSMGIGKLLIGEAIARAQHRGCRLLQLTTDKRRLDARAFYERLGFKPSHDGMKLKLSNHDDDAHGA